nr:BspA family leucine-rich repeat surface protein [Synechococcus sp. KORDI-100]
MASGQHAFRGANISSENEAIESLDTSNLEDFTGIFGETDGFKSNLSDWKVGNVDSLSAAFEYSKDFTANISTWNTENVKSMYDMIAGAENFSADISQWNVSNVENMMYVFRDSINNNVDISKWDVGEVDKMTGMFEDSTFQDEINISNWNVSKVEKMDYMFEDAKDFNSDLSKWNVSRVEDMGSMFYGAIKFESDISEWDVSNVETMIRMFSGAENFNSNLSNWDVSNVHDMEEMFKGAKEFNQDISKWDVHYVDDMRKMFKNAESFNQDLSGWCVEGIDEEPDAFGEGSKLSDEHMPKWGECPTAIYGFDTFDEGVTGDDGPSSKAKTPKGVTFKGRNDNDDTLFGLSGDDTLKGKSGNDALYGGDDDDLIITGTKEKDDGINFADGGNGDDEIYSNNHDYDEKDIIGLKSSKLKPGKYKPEEIKFNEKLADTLIGGNGKDLYISQGGMSIIEDYEGDFSEAVTELDAEVDDSANHEAVIITNEDSGLRMGVLIESPVDQENREIWIFKPRKEGKRSEYIIDETNLEFSEVNEKYIQNSDYSLKGRILIKSKVDDDENPSEPIQDGGGNSGGGGDDDDNGGGSGSGGGIDFPGDSTQDTGNDSKIDGESIGIAGDGGSAGENNQLRVVTIEKQPSKDNFDVITRGTREDEKYKGNKAVDKQRGRAGDDTLIGAGGDDYQYGGKGADKLRGNKGSDVLLADSGKDLLKAGKGDDVAYGGKGNDTLTGGKGEDVFVLSSGKDVVTDFNVNQDGIGVVYAIDLQFNQKGDDLQIKGNDGVNTLLLNTDKEEFLANYPNNLEVIPVVEVDVI